MKGRRGVMLLGALLAVGCSLVTPKGPAPGSESDPEVAVSSAEAHLRRFPQAVDRAPVLLRLALLRLDDRLEVADHARAVSLLERLTEEHEASEEAATARALLSQIRRQGELENELAQRQAELASAAERLAELAALVSEKDAEVAESESEASANDLETSRIADRLGVIRAELQRCTARVAELEEELELLKKIDLDERP